MNAWNVLGQEQAVASLQASLAIGRVAHAYLMVGPPGVGKLRLAHCLAQALICVAGQVNPCGTCRACTRVDHGTHPDVRMGGIEDQQRFLGKDTASRDLRVEYVRDFHANLSLRPYEARRRVLILADAERLTEAAANALLKTLEEPPPYATLILLAPDSSTLLPTIISRCRVVRLRPIPTPLLIDHLAARVEQARAAEVAALSDGSLRRAEQLLAGPEELERLQQMLEALGSLPAQNLQQRLVWASEQARAHRDNPLNTQEILSLWLGWWRDVLCTSEGQLSLVRHQARLPQLTTTAQRVSRESCITFLTRLRRASRLLHASVGPELVFEDLALNIPALGG